MKTSLRILNIVLLLCIVISSLASCEIKTTTTTPKVNTPPAFVDYVSDIKLNMTSNRIRQEVTVHQFIDGDTTHFNVPTTISRTGILKARYLGIDTPESTGAIEEWGKAASKFTKTSLSNAVSIILESDTGEWNYDSTGERVLVWVWYKTADMTDYRNLNLDLLQEGLARATSLSGNTYASNCKDITTQAKAHKLYLFSQEKDPDFYYGDAIQLTIRELVANPEKYLNKTVAFEGVVTKDDGGSIYIEEYCEETGMYHGITAYKGYNLPGAGLEIIQVGNRVKIVGSMQYWEGGGIYQISDLSYRIMKPDDPDNIQLISKGHSGAFVLTTPEAFCNQKLSLTIIDEEGNEIDKEFSYAELALNTTIEMKDLKVTKIYTTNNGGDNDGAMTITCQADGYTITVRTEKLYLDGVLVTADYFSGKTIDVKGIVGYYNGSYQIKLLSLNDVVIK